MNHIQITGAHERFMKSVKREMETLNRCLTTFLHANRSPLRSKTLWTRRESEFRASDRKERAKEIHLDDIEAHAVEMASKQPH